MPPLPVRNRPALSQGHVAADVRLPGCTIADVVHPPDGRYPMHAHDRPSVGLVLSGSLREHAGGRDALAEAGSVIVLPPGWRHADVIAPTGARILLAMLDARHALHARFDAWRVERTGPATRAMLGLLRARATHTLDACAAEEGLLATADALARTPDAPRRSPVVVRRAEDLLRAHGDAPLRLTDVARAVGVDRTYLARAFRRAHGCTMSEFRRRVRLERAMSLLAARMSPSHAAAGSGFVDQSHLTRTLRATLGVTPGEYRRIASSGGLNREGREGR